MKILVIDGQGGRMGAALVERIKADTQCQVIAVGTNSIATAAMLRAGADAGATGENPVVVNARDADFIVGPMGIVMADALLGEITPRMAAAIGASPARRVLIPVSRCNTVVTGMSDLGLSDHVRLAAQEIIKAAKG